MIYLDNAATSFPKPPEVGAAMSRFLAEAAANPGRAGHRLAVGAEQMIDAARLAVARLFNCRDPQRLVFTLNCTDALNIAIKGVLAADGSEHVVTTVLEHNSVSRPLEAMAASGRIELTRVRCDGAGFVDPDEIRRAIRPSTRLVVVTHASNVLGTIQDAHAVGAIAREHDLLFCLDAAQTAGVLDIDVDAMNVDLLAFPGHKSLLGPTGTGGLYAGPRCPAPGEFHAWREGGTGGDSSSPTQPRIYPYFLEGGTPNTVGIEGLRAALDHLVARGVGAALAHERRLVQALLDRLDPDDRFEVYGRPAAENRVGTVSLNVRGIDPADVAAILDESFDIAVRPGLHCAPYCHREIGTYPAGTVRISPGPFNTDEDLDALLDALEQIAG